MTRGAVPRALRRALPLGLGLAPLWAMQTMTSSLRHDTWAGWWEIPFDVALAAILLVPCAALLLAAPSGQRGRRTPLTRAQRRRVDDAVAAGTPDDDPRLRSAEVELARERLATSGRVVALPCGMLAVLGAVEVCTVPADIRPGWLWVYALGASVWLGACAASWDRARRRQAQAFLDAAGEA